MIDAFENAAKLERNQNAALDDIRAIKSSLESVKVSEPWQAHFSDKHQRLYYYNPETKVSLWELPNGAANNLTAINKSVTGVSTSSPEGLAGPRVEDGLIQKGLAYVKRREDMRQKQELELQAVMTGKPQISKFARHYGANRDHSESIADRAAAALKAKREKEDQLRMQIEQREQNEMIGRPVITKKSQKLNRNVEDMLSWDDQRRTRLAIKQSEMERQQDQMVTPGPVIATSRAVTDRLLKNRKSEGVPIEERLQQYEEIRQYKRERAAEKADREARLAANPTIMTNRPSRPSPRVVDANHELQKPTQILREKWEEDDDGCSDEAEELWSDEEEYALHLENMARLRALEMDESLAHRAGQRFVSFSQRTAGGGDVSGSGNSGQGRSVADLAGERMHREAEQIQMSKRAEAHQRLQSNTNYGPDGKPMFQPHLNPTSVKIAERRRGHDVPVEELLFRKGQEREERIKMRQEKKISEQKAQSNSSKINPISEKIAREREIIEGREGESRIERLSRPIGAVKRNILEGIEKPTFAPKISKKSTELATKGNYFSAGRRARSSSADRSRPSRSINNDHGCVEDLMNEYLDSAGDLSEQSNEYYSRGDITDPDEAIDQKYETKLYERTNTWAKQRQDKIERDRLVRAEEQMRDCTFRPQLQKAPAQDGLVRGRDNSRRQGMHIDRSSSAHSGREYRDSSSDNEFRRVGGGDDYSSRQASWAHKRDMKLEIERRRREREEIESCSFAPNLSHQNPKDGNKVKINDKPQQMQSTQERALKIPLPSRVTKGPNGGIQYPPGGFSYDTPYTDFNAEFDNAKQPTSYLGSYHEPSYGAATRLDFGADDEVGGNVSYPAYQPQNRTTGPIPDGSKAAYIAETVYKDMMSSPPPNMYPANGVSFGNNDDGGFDDSNEYGAEFELDECGDVINTANFDRYR